MQETFCGLVPDDLLYDISHDMWVKPSGGEVLVGASSFGIFLAGRIIAFTAKPRGGRAGRGRGIGTVECAKTVLAIHAPVALQLTDINELLEENPELLNLDPYAAWMVRGTPTDWETDARSLVDATAYRAHIRTLDPRARFL